MRDSRSGTGKTRPRTSASVLTQRVLGLAALAAGLLAPAGAAPGSLTPTRARTIAVTPWRIGDLAAAGRRLAWGDGFQRIEVFDRVTHRVTTLARHLCGEATAMKGPVLAGKRVLFACEWGSNTGVDAAVYTAALNDRRALRVKGFYDVSREAGNVGELYGPPVRIAGGGGALAFFGFDGSWERPHAGVWRVFGRRAVWLHYGSPQQLLIDIAVAGRRLATAEWVTRCGCDTLPAWSPDGREIAWNHGGTIWLMSSDGKGQRPLSTAGSADLNTGPRWSPSGSTLAFEGKGEINLINRDGTNQRKLVSGVRPAWSPEGTRLAFVRANDLWTVNADGSGERRLTSAALETSSRADWSPDGKNLVVARANNIYMVDVATGAEHDLTPGERPESDLDPVWSPDGSRIAFARECISTDCTGGSIYVVRPDGSGLTRVSDGEIRFLSDAMPAWSPDGTRIAYVAERDLDTQEIRIVNADGTGRKALNSREGAGAPAWSADGRTIASGDSAVNFFGYGAAVFRGNSGIYAVDPTGRGRRWLAAPTKLSTTVEVRDSVTGKLLRRWEVPSSVPSCAPNGCDSGPAVAISGRYVVARVWRRGLGYILARYDSSSGTVFGTTRFPKSASALSLAGRWGAYRVGRRIRLLDVKTGHSSTLAVAGRGAVGPLIEGNRIFWAENYHNGSRVREIVLRETFTR